jgi:glutathione S-transferase
MKLYYTPGACSLAPHITAREAGIPIELKRVDLKTKTVDTPGDFTQVNSKGYVPALATSQGPVLTECPAIMQYLADQKPESGLAPQAGSMARYQLQEWLNFVTSELHKALGTFFNPAVTEEWRKAVSDRLALRLDWLNKELTGKPFAMGDKFTVVDAYIFTILNWAPMVKFDLARWPAIVDYQKRIAARPKVQEAMKAEGLLG